MPDQPGCTEPERNLSFLVPTRCARLYTQVYRKTVIPADTGIHTAWTYLSSPSMALNTRFPAGMTSYYLDTKRDGVLQPPISFGSTELWLDYGNTPGSNKVLCDSPVANYFWHTKYYLFHMNAHGNQTN